MRGMGSRAEAKASIGAGSAITIAFSGRSKKPHGASVRRVTVTRNRGLLAPG